MWPPDSVLSWGLCPRCWWVSFCFSELLEIFLHISCEWTREPRLSHTFEGRSGYYVLLLCPRQAGRRGCVSVCVVYVPGAPGSPRVRPCTSTLPRPKHTPSRPCTFSLPPLSPQGEPFWFCRAGTEGPTAAKPAITRTPFNTACSVTDGSP